MKELLERKLAGVTDAARRKGLLREFLHHLILQTVDRRGDFRFWAFVRGTALRVLHGIPRFSQDLDFSVLEGGEKLSLEAAAAAWSKDIESWGWKVELGPVRGGHVKNCHLKFPGLFREWGITNDPREKLSIKIEVDFHPPEGYGLKTSVVQKDFFFAVTHHDLPTLFAGKLTAFLCRTFLKGRDIYDILWLSARRVPANFPFLRNGIGQTGGKEPVPESVEELKAKLLQKVQSIDFSKVRRELEPFLEDPSELRLIRKELLSQAVSEMVIERRT